MVTFHKNAWFTLANMLTISRLLLAPVIAWCIICGANSCALVLFCIAAATDTIDGRLARSTGTQTVMGKLLDPVADKVLMLFTFGALVWVSAGIPLWFFIVLASREFLLVLGAFVLILLGRTATIVPSLWGKLTTFLQVIFVGWFFIGLLMNFQSYQSNLIWVISIVFFSLVSFGDYIYRNAIK